MPDEKPTPSVAESLLEAIETIQPVFDAADGIKKDMEQRGWTAESAETAALTFLTGFLGTIWS